MRYQAKRASLMTEAFSWVKNNKIIRLVIKLLNSMGAWWAPPTLRAYKRPSSGTSIQTQVTSTPLPRTTSTTSTMCGYYGNYYGGRGYGCCGYGGLGYGYGGLGYGYGGLGCGYGSCYGCGYRGLGCGYGCGYGYGSRSLCGCGYGYGSGYGSGFGYYY